MNRAVDVLRAYERWQAARALLALPDPPEMPKRGFRLTYEGASERVGWYQYLPLAHRTYAHVDRDEW